MLYANDENGKRIRAEKGLRALCPLCGAAMIAKCGDYVVHHWAHEVVTDCDPWAEGETEWHLGWKARFPVERQEVVIGTHRADVLGRGGVILELQHSPISIDEVAERGLFYRRLLWLWDAREFFCRLYHRDDRGYRRPGIELAARFRHTSSDIYPKEWGFVWPHWRPSMGACSLPIFWDFGGDIVVNGELKPALFRVDRLVRPRPGESYRDEAGNWRTDGQPATGTGSLITVDDFVARYVDLPDDAPVQTEPWLA